MTRALRPPQELQQLFETMQLGFSPHDIGDIVKLADPPVQEVPTREEDLMDAAAKAEAAGAESPDQIIKTVGESRLVAQLLGESDSGSKS